MILFKHSRLFNVLGIAVGIVMVAISVYSCKKEEAPPVTDGKSITIRFTRDIVRVDLYNDTVHPSIAGTVASVVEIATVKYSFLDKHLPAPVEVKMETFQEEKQVNFNFKDLSFNTSYNYFVVEASNYLGVNEIGLLPLEVYEEVDKKSGITLSVPDTVYLSSPNESIDIEAQAYSDAHVRNISIYRIDHVDSVCQEILVHTQPYSVPTDGVAITRKASRKGLDVNANTIAFRITATNNYKHIDSKLVYIRFQNP